MLPPKAHLIVSVISTDDPKVTELTEERGYSVVTIMPLKEKEREDIALVRKPIHFRRNLTVERLIGQTCN